MNKKSFTLIEILVALIVLSIIASVSVAFYQKTVDANNERICTENLKVLQAAIDIYTVENDALPLQLSQLTPRHIYLAYSRVIGERKENLLGIAFRKMFSTEVALAETQGQLFKRRYLSGKKKLFHDPAAGTFINDPTSCNDLTQPCGSYNFNFTANKTLDSTGKKLDKTSNFALISDSSDRLHKGKFSTTSNPYYSIGITPSGRVGKVNGTGADRYIQ